MDVRIKKSWNVLLYSAVFFVSFIFFTYLTFPYGVLKEALTAQIGKSVGLSIRIEEFGPSLPLGFKAKNVRIAENSGGPVLAFDRVEVSVSILRLFIGQLGVGVKVIDPAGGRLGVNGAFGLFKLMDKNFLPNFVELESQKFGIKDVVALCLAHLAQSPGTNPMLAPMLPKVGMVGFLNGAANFDIDAANLPQSTGIVNLQFTDAALTIDEPALNLGEQKFDKAALRAGIKGGILDLSDASGFHTQGLILDLAGTIKLQADMGRSQLDINISLKLDNALKEQFGMLLDMVGGSGGALKLNVKGTLDQPSMATI